jgi:arsenite methyltransferase
MARSFSRSVWISLFVIGVLTSYLYHQHLHADQITGWFLNQIAENARAPKVGHPLGWLTQKLMKKVNADRSVKIVDTLNPAPGSVLVELGPGNGLSLDHLLTAYPPKRVYGIDISERFRSILHDKFTDEIEDGVLSIHENDAKDLDFLRDASVDAVYALNVLYFLDPLHEYLQEIHRILKPNGKVVFGVSDEARIYSDTDYFVNTDWEKCLEAMRTAGFDSVEMGTPQEARFGMPFVPLLGIKPAGTKEEEIVIE